MHVSIIVIILEHYSGSSIIAGMTNGFIMVTLWQEITTVFAGV